MNISPFINVNILVLTLHTSWAILNPVTKNYSKTDVYNVRGTKIDKRGKENRFDVVVPATVVFHTQTYPDGGATVCDVRGESPYAFVLDTKQCHANISSSEVCECISHALQAEMNYTLLDSFNR